MDKEWILRDQQEPDISLKRILVYNKQNDLIHLLHQDYDEWVLSETEYDFPGCCVDFSHWMELPNKPLLS